jgi:iron complex outermembrane receptor protein
LADAELPGTITAYEGPPENPTAMATAYAKYKFTIDERISGVVQANYARYERLPHSGYRNAFTGSFTPPFTQAYKYAFGERFQLEPRVTMELEKHVLSAGLTADYSSTIPKTVDLTSPYDTSRGPGAQGFNYVGSAIPAKLFEEESFNTGMFLQAQTEWNERLSSTVGLRLDYNSEYGETVNPRLGLVFQQTPETSWKMLYGRSYLAPSAHLRFENFGSFDVNPTTSSYFFIANPDLRPEELQTLELSLTHKLTDEVTVGVVGFYSLLNQAILFTDNVGANTTFIPGATLNFTQQYRNVGELTARGVELTVDYTIKTGGSRLDLWGSFTYINGEVHDKNQNIHYDLPFTSTEMLKLGATWNYNDRIVVTPSVNWNGPQAGAAANNTTGFGTRTTDFYVVNLYGPSQNLALFVRADNLLDKRYYNAGFGGFSNFYLTPQDSRAITVGVTGRF